ncbi:MAG: serine/threonine-protein kinase [Deltaproteobacteria bacterium]
MPPRCVGPWEILTVIGRGGVGTVYRARHLLDGMPAAVKLLGPAPAVDPTSARRLAREFEVLRALQHPNVVRVFDAGQAEGYSWLAMELVEGLDLRTYLAPLAGAPILELSSVHGPSTSCEGSGLVFDMEAWLREPETHADVEAIVSRPPGAGVDDIRAFADLMEEPETNDGSGSWERGADPPHMVDLAAGEEPEPEPPSSALAMQLNRPERMARMRAVLGEVLGALAFVHGRGFVHRDLKPSNIMVDDARRARIMDFGLVKQLVDSNSLTLSGRVVGTYRYMAPEQAAGRDVDHRADLWSMGVILYELLVGRPPFPSSVPAELWREITTVEPPAILDMNPGADPLLAAASERLLRKDPAMRHQTAAEAMAAAGLSAPSTQ